MERVVLDCDLREGRFHVEGSESSVMSVVERLEGLLAKFWNPSVADQAVRGGAPASTNGGGPAGSTEEVPQKNEETGSGRAAPRPRRVSTGRGASYNFVELDLGEPQREELRQFFAEKAPSGQNEAVAVLTVKAAELLNKKTFTVDEVFSLTRLVDIKSPKDLRAVFKNMRSAGLGRADGAEFTVNYLTEDFVHKDLPRQQGKK